MKKQKPKKKDEKPRLHTPVRPHRPDDRQDSGNHNNNPDNWQEFIPNKVY